MRSGVRCFLIGQNKNPLVAWTRGFLFSPFYVTGLALKLPVAAGLTPLSGGPSCF